jgi:hypothetical protein
MYYLYRSGKIIGHGIISKYIYLYRKCASQDLDSFWIHDLLLRQDSIGHGVSRKYSLPAILICKERKCTTQVTFTFSIRT